MTSYLIPAETSKVTTAVSNSRFITTIERVTSTEEVRQTLARIRDEMPDANHHVYAFRIGHGKSVTEGLSDDGEPSGTSGPPVLAVLRGSNIGDILIVVTRYFGGTKLGTGGLVRAYSDAARAGLAALKTEEKRLRHLVGVEVSYAAYEYVKRLITKYEGLIEDETFTGDITIILQLPVEHLRAFDHDLSELTGGKSHPLILG